MKALHFDIFAGISGDMILGALVDAGLEADRLETELRKLDIPKFSIAVRKVARGELSGTKLDFELPHEHAHRGLSEIRQILDTPALPERARSRALSIFERIARAEAHIHQIPVEEIHFHEIGAMDSILDVAGAVIGLELMGIEHVSSSSVPTGRGTVETDHGVMPVPAPATLALLENVPCRPGLADGEVTTPTGAAIIAEVARQFGDLPEGVPRAIGYGAGSREGGKVPNLLRVVLFDASSASAGEVVKLEANLDDMSPQFFGYLFERLFDAGALDVYLTPIYMKKNRPGTQVSVLCKLEDVFAAKQIILSETPSLGVRFTRMSRWELPRSIITVETRFGPIRVKTAGSKMAAEFEDCAQAAREHQMPIGDVYEEVMRLAREKAREP